jgi:hypothetical protein
MGYRHKPAIYRLQLHDEEFEGLEIVMRSIPLGELLGLMQIQDGLDSDNPDVREVEQMIKLFAGKLIGWNLEDEEGTKIPANFTGVKTLDIGFFLTLVGAWVQAMSGVPKELGKGSQSGGTFPEVDVPTEALSPSLQS